MKITAHQISVELEEATVFISNESPDEEMICLHVTQIPWLIEALDEIHAKFANGPMFAGEVSSNGE